MAHLVHLGHRLIERVQGPFKLRLIVQPLVAAALAVRAGVRDQRTGQPPFLWSLAFTPARRRELLRGWWKDSGKVFLVALVLDCIYQLVVTHTVRVGEMIAVAALLAIVPYVVLRGLVTRLAGFIKTHGQRHGGTPTPRVT
jgi:hypothetical protein